MRIVVCPQCRMRVVPIDDRCPACRTVLDQPEEVSSPEADAKQPESADPNDQLDQETDVPESTAETSSQEENAAEASSEKQEASAEATDRDDTATESAAVEHHTLRIFISSPGDVSEERDGARRVIESLQRLYTNVTLQPVLWEELALPATASFQETIDYLLERHPVDIAVFILWSRLGSPLGAAITRADGSPYRSGTERELDLMLAAFEQSGGERPVVLAYARDDDAAFKERLTEAPKSDLGDLIDQQKLAESFIREQFHDSEGHNVRAYQTYHQPIDFMQRLRLHLRQAIDDTLGSSSTARWTDEPFRGLETFELQHAPIFHGRDEETCELLMRLRTQDEAGCAFVVIVGASGSGKSSLARAGVAANLQEIVGASDERLQWKTSTLVPALASGALCTALARCIADAIPEVKSAVDDIASGLASDPELTTRLSVTPAFRQASEKAGGTVRLLLILDQLEELWTDRQTTPPDREQFLLAVETLAKSGHVAVVSTLRSDFYSAAQQMPIFLRMKGDSGHYDLLPPDTASLHRLILEPARLAGLHFERDEQTGRSLDTLILEDATRDPGALPLLQYTLNELYGLRDQQRGLLTFDAYAKLGGVEGALSKRADEVFQGLPVDARTSIDEILPMLVTVDVAGEQAAVRRRAAIAELAATPARRKLTDAFIKARFLTTDRHGESAIASLAHEALLRRWPRITNWINDNRDLLRIRVRVEQSNQHWKQSDRDASLLLPSGLPLEEGRQLLRDARHLTNGELTQYIDASIKHHESVAKRTQRRRLVTLVSLSVLTIAATISAAYGWIQRRDAIDQRTLAEYQLYMNQINGADSAIEYGRHDVAAELLSSIPAEEQQWEARYLARQAMGTPLTLTGHQDSIDKVAFSPDRTQFLSADRDGVLRTWDATTGEPIHIIQGADAGYTLAQYSGDGKWIIGQQNSFATFMRSQAHVWNAETGKKVETHAGASRAVLSPDRMWIAKSGVLGMLSVAPITDAGKNAFRSVPLGLTLEAPGTPSGDSENRESDMVWKISFRPDAKRIVATIFDSDVIKVWNVKNGKQLHRLDGHEAPATEAVYSPDGQLIASSSEDTTVKIWNAGSGDELLTLSGHADKVSCVAFSPDGVRVVSGGDDSTVRVWDAESGAKIHTLRWVESTSNRKSIYRPPNDSLIQSAYFSPDGRYVFASSREETTIWDANDGSVVMTLANSDAEELIISPDSRRLLAVGSDRLIRVLDLATGVELMSLGGHGGQVSAVAFSPDGTRIVSGSTDNTVKVWNAQPQSVWPIMTGHTDRITSIVFRSDGKRIASSSADGTIRIWDTASGAELNILRGHNGPVRKAVFSPNGKWIASWGEDQILKVWESESGSKVFSFQDAEEGKIVSVEFSPDNKRILAGLNHAQAGLIKVWDATTYDESLSQRFGYGTMSSASFLDGGRQIQIEAGNYGEWIAVWDTETGEKIRSGVVDEEASDSPEALAEIYEGGHDGEVTSVQQLPGGKRLITASADRTLMVWDVETGARTLTLRGHDINVTVVAITPDGQRVASGDASGQLRIWDARQQQRTTAHQASPWEEDAARRSAFEKAWHEQDASDAEAASNWFAARFHLRRLSDLSPDDSSIKERLERAETMLEVTSPGLNANQ